MNPQRRVAWGMVVMSAGVLVITIKFQPRVVRPGDENAVAEGSPQIVPVESVGTAPVQPVIDEARVGVTDCLAVAGAANVRLLLDVTIGPTGVEDLGLTGADSLDPTARACLLEAVEAAPWPARNAPMSVVFGVSTMAQGD